MRIFLWHVHGSWTTALVQGRHEYLVPVLADRGPYGLGRARTWDWPASVREVTFGKARDEAVDVLILQRPEELDHLAQQWLGGRRPGREVPAVYVEHNTPKVDVPDTRHPVADRPDLMVAHVTHFNRLFWDTGFTPSRVIEHGVVDPGLRYTGEIPRAAVAVNEGPRRGRVTGTDLLPSFAEAAPLDVFGMDAQTLSALPGVRTYENLVQSRLHQEMARRRVYLHPIRWTSLGLSLIEAMHLGMPVVALATTEVPVAVPPDAGVVSTDVDELKRALRRLIEEPEEARLKGKAARAAALERYGLDRFLRDWDDLFEQVVSR